MTSPAGRTAGLATLLGVAVAAGFLFGRATAPSAPPAATPPEAAPRRDGPAPGPEPAPSPPSPAIPKPPAPAAPERKPAPPAAARDAVTAEAFGVKIPENPTAGDLRKAVGALRVELHPQVDPRKTLEADLLLRILRDFPADEGTKDDFRTLFHLLLARNQPDRAAAALEELGGKAGFATWEAEEYRANLATNGRDWPAARAAFQRVADDSAAPEWKRVDAQFWVAYSVAEAGDRPLARSLYQAILDRYGSSDDPHLRNTIGGAREQVRLLDDTKR